MTGVPRAVYRVYTTRARYHLLGTPCYPAGTTPSYRAWTSMCTSWTSLDQHVHLLDVPGPPLAGFLDPPRTTFCRLPGPSSDHPFWASWTSLDHPFWASWTSLDHHLRLPGPSSDHHLRLPGPSSDHPGLSWTSLDHPGLSWTSLDHPLRCPKVTFLGYS